MATNEIEPGPARAGTAGEALPGHPARPRPPSRPGQFAEAPGDVAAAAGGQPRERQTPPDEPLRQEPAYTERRSGRDQLVYDAAQGIAIQTAGSIIAAVGAGIVAAHLLPAVAALGIIAAAAGLLLWARRRHVRKRDRG